MKNILFFTEISPFPINGGERIRSYGLIKALSKSGFNIFAVIKNEDNADLTKYSLPNVTYIEYNVKFNLFKYVFCIDLFKKRASVTKILKKIIDENKIDCAFLDYGFIGHYISFFKKRNIPVILGTHNSQSNLTSQEPTKNLIEKIRKAQRIFLQKIHEKRFFKKADKIIVVSEGDYSFHKKFVPEDKIYIIPNFLDEEKYTVQNIDKEDYLVMTANFNAYMNYFGTKWFLEKIWDNEIAAKTQLLLVGKGSAEILSKLGTYTNVKATGMVDDIVPYIASSKAVIIPLLHGSGSRLKCIEAMALKTKIIATSKGVEGIDCDSFIIADTPEEFKKSVIEIIYNKPIIDEDSYSVFINKYSISAVKNDLINIINSL